MPTYRHALLASFDAEDVEEPCFAQIVEMLGEELDLRVTVLGVRLFPTGLGPAAGQSKERVLVHLLMQSETGLCVQDIENELRPLIVRLSGETVSAITAESGT